MKAGFIYLIFVSLLICLFPFTGNASLEKVEAISSDKEMVYTYEDITPATDKFITHDPISLLQYVAVKNKNTHISTPRILCSSSEVHCRKKLQNDLSLHSQSVSVPIYFHSSGYYIYTLEKIRI